MEKIDYKDYTIEELELIAPYDPEAEAELRRREEASPDAAPPKATVPETESAAPPEPGDAAAAYAETMERLQAVQQHELNRRWREEEDPYAGLAYAARLLRDSDSVSERTAAMDMLRKLEIVFMEQLGEQKGVPRLALRDVQLFLAAGYRSGVRATGESDALAELAFRRYENAYELDSGCVGTLAWCWQTGYGTRKDPKRAAQLLEAAHDGSAASWKRLGDAYALLGWNAKAEECFTAAQQQEKRRRRLLRQRLSKRTLRIIAGVLVVMVIGQLALGAVLSSGQKTQIPGSAPASAAGTTQDWLSDITYYGILRDAAGNPYYGELTLDKAEQDGSIPAELTLKMMDMPQTIYLRACGMITDLENGTIELNPEGLTAEDYRWENTGVLEMTLRPMNTTESENGATENENGDVYGIRVAPTDGITSGLGQIGFIGNMYSNQDSSQLLNAYYMAGSEIDLFSVAECEADPTLMLGTSRPSKEGLRAEYDQTFGRDDLTSYIAIREASPPVGTAAAVFQLYGLYKTLHFETISFADRTGREKGYYEIWLDGEPITQEAQTLDTKFGRGISIDVTGVQELRIVLVSKDGGVNGNNDIALANLYVFK